MPKEGLTLRFQLSRPPRTPELDEFNLKLVTDQGAKSFVLSDADYSAAGVNLAEARRVGEPCITPEGTPCIILHENGPDIQLNGAPLEATLALAERLRDSLNAQVRTRQLEVFLPPPGKTIEQSRPNLRLVLPEGGARALIGYLGPEPLIRIERIGGDPAKPAAILLIAFQNNHS